MTATEVRNLISNDLWQATNIDSVGVKEFTALDATAEKLTENDDRMEFKTLCDQAIEESAKAPIAASYLATMTGRHPMDDRHIFHLLEQYYIDSRWPEVMFLGNKILTFTESQYALKVLAECYTKNNMQDKKIETWERLIKVDFEETDVLYKLIDYFEKKGDVDATINYCRILLRRHLKKQDINSIINVWDKILALRSDSPKYLIGLADKIADSLGSDRGVFALQSIYDKVDCDLNSRIDILKKIIRYAPHDKISRDKLVGLWKEKYKDNNRLEYCLNNTGILDDYLNINVAIEKFEKQIGFVEGAFVFHDSWKLGQIKSIAKDEMKIMFGSRGMHTMSCQMAYSSLRVLPKGHIWVLKVAFPKEKLAERFMDKSKIEWGLKVLLTSFNDQASLKQMKGELVPSVLSESQWADWQAAAKKELSSNQYFGISDSDNDVYVLRSTPITYEEKALALFKGTKGKKEFYPKLKILRDFLSHKGETESDEFAAMISYFESKAHVTDPDGTAAFLVLDNLKNKKGMSFITLNGSFLDFYNRISNKKEFFESIDDNEVKRSFIENVKDSVDKWLDVVVSLYPSYMNAFMAKTISDGSKKRLYKVLSDSVLSCRENPDFFIYLTNTFGPKDWEKAKVSQENLMITKLALLSVTNKRIDNSIDVAENKKRQALLMDSLFKKDKEVQTYLEAADPSQAQKLYSIVKGIPGIETERLSMKHTIINKFDNHEEILGEKQDKEIDRKKIIPTGLLCTKAMLEAKKQELDHIMNVEIPENSKEIGIARALGDLRENAEYQYGKDKQKNLNFLMNKLTDEVSAAQVIYPENVDLQYVSFGTKVTFKDNKTGEDVSYTLFGPWESDPSKNILNFKAPLGQAIYNMEVGETKKFNINGIDYDYTVKTIELANF